MHLNNLGGREVNNLMWMDGWQLLKRCVRDDLGKGGMSWFGFEGEGAFGGLVLKQRGNF